jgi:hypothetical protein
MLEGNISSSLGRLKSLQALMLDHNLLSGSIPPELGNLSNLLFHFPITAYLEKFLPNLEDA